MKRRLTTLAVTGLVVIGGGVAATPAYAAGPEIVDDRVTGHLRVDVGNSGTWTNEGMRAVGSFHFRWGRNQNGQDPYRWADMLDKKRVAETRIILRNSKRAEIARHVKVNYSLGTWSNNFGAAVGNSADYMMNRF